MILVAGGIHSALCGRGSGPRRRAIFQQSFDCSLLRHLCWHRGAQGHSECVLTRSRNQRDLSIIHSHVLLRRLMHKLLTSSQITDVQSSSPSLMCYSIGKRVVIALATTKETYHAEAIGFQSG